MNYWEINLGVIKEELTYEEIENKLIALFISLGNSTIFGNLQYYKRRIFCKEKKEFSNTISIIIYKDIFSDSSMLNQEISKLVETIDDDFNCKCKVI